MTSWATLAELAHPGDSIRERRAELGWTQAELSKRTGVPQADISRLENGRLDARWSTIQRLSAALADPAALPQRSLSNGRKISKANPTSGTTQWSPRGKVLEIGDAER
jgi:transcriptional regulator with XRE-family HTH domain